MSGERRILPVLMLGVDEAAGRLQARLDGLTDDEYRWEPVPGCWSVRETSGGWRVDGTDPAPEPAPVTTIAWRMWHIASFCLAEYVSPHLGEWPLPVAGSAWHGDAMTARRDLDTAVDVFRTRATALGEDGLWAQLGDAWGPFAESTWADLVVHALDELAHHGAEIALLRDLYRARG